ncbi:MAG: hypothetical protein GWP17_05890 [Aquificales bacterium]|nr:hypothetical protein [Aquificales bacterium]
MSKRKFTQLGKKKNRKAKQQPKRPLLTTWPIEPNIPTNSLLTYNNLDDPADLERIMDDFIYELESGCYLQWEAVISQEQGLPLTAKQEEALAALLYFGDDLDDRILYINEISRPEEPWYAIAGKLAPRMVKHPFSTAEIMYGIYGDEGWPRLVDTIEEHCQYLSLPADVKAPLDIFSPDLRHTLWLQSCFDQLCGLGQDEELTLVNEGQQDRVKWFIQDLHEHKDTVQYFDLTLDSLLTRLILPSTDKALFISMTMVQLNLPSTQTPLAEYM